MSRPYRVSKAQCAAREGRIAEERERIAAALRAHDGNVMRAWKADLRDYPERTLKRWIRRLGLQLVVDEARRKARELRLGKRADRLAVRHGASPDFRASAPSKPNG